LNEAQKMRAGYNQQSLFTVHPANRKQMRSSHYELPLQKQYMDPAADKFAKLFSLPHFIGQ
jgi:hypothetical protein